MRSVFWTESATAILPAAQRAHQTQLQRMLARFPTPLQQMATRFLDQAQETSLEAQPTAQAPLVIQWGWLPAVTFTCALGVFSIASGFAVARQGQPGLELTFVVGLLLIFVPAMVRQLSATPPRLERIGLVCVVGICLYLIKIMASPAYFSMYDEFLHWRTLDDITTTGHLFTPNALLPVSSYYPGLEIVTDALSTMSGLSTFSCALLVIGIARFIMVLSLFLLNEQMMQSSRVAGIATLIYMGNPHFLLFDAQYAYESLALPLATTILWMMAPHQVASVRLTRLEPLSPLLMFARTRRKQLNHHLLWMTCTTGLVIAAVVFTHHVTDFFLDGILILWVIIYGCLHLTPLSRSHLTKVTVIGLVITVASIMRGGNPVLPYLGSFLQTALKELDQILLGASSAKPLFHSYTGTPTPLWERVLTVTSQGLVMLGLPVGLLGLWHRYRSNALARTFSIMALGYPLAQVFRFTTSGSELVDRSAAFLFIPISSVLAILVVQFWPIVRLKRTHYALQTTLLSVIFLGGIILGSGPSFALLPGPYMVSADPRSIEAEGIEAAMWASASLGPGNRIDGDRVNQILMGTYGRQRVVTSIQDGIDTSSVFLSSRLTPDEIALLQQGKIRYIVVDLRLSKQLPVLGYYYSEGEIDAFQHTTPLPPQFLTKFDTFAGANKVFSSGDLVIYDMEGVLNATP